MGIVYWIYKQRSWHLYTKFTIIYDQIIDIQWSSGYDMHIKEAIWTFTRFRIVSEKKENDWNERWLDSKHLGIHLSFFGFSMFTRQNRCKWMDGLKESPESPFEDAALSHVMFVFEGQRSGWAQRVPRKDLWRAQGGMTSKSVQILPNEQMQKMKRLWTFACCRAMFKT